MDNNSNSGVSLILNPDIANAIDDNHHQHDLSTCEEEFENQEEIQQMLANAFDSQSLSNTENDEQVFDDDDDDEQSPPVQNLMPIDHQLSEENETLRRRLAEYVLHEQICQKNTLEYERQMNELNEKHEQFVFTLRLDFETKIEQLTNKTSDQQIEMMTLKQMYETILDEKHRADDQIDEFRQNERRIKENFEQLQIELEQKRRPTMSSNVEIQTEVDDNSRQQLEDLTKQNAELTGELIRAYNERDTVQSHFDEHERHFLIEKIRYENQIKELSVRPATTCMKIQTDTIDDDKLTKQLQIELNDYRLKINSKQMEINMLKLDLSNLKHEMNDRLSLSNQNLITERDQYLCELNTLKQELPVLKQQMIDSFQTKVVTFKDQVKKSLYDKDLDYRRKLEQIENEYINQYEQVLAKNKQFVRTLLTSKQEEFNVEKSRLIDEYQTKLNLQPKMSDEERRGFEQKIEELTRANEKCSQYIARREHEHRQRAKSSLDTQLLDETKRKSNEEIHRLYDQITKQNQQQILLIDEHQQQLEQLKITYDQRYRTILDEWKIYNNDLHNDNNKMKQKLKEYEKTCVQLRYHIINLQIEHLQNGGGKPNQIHHPIL